MTLAARPRRFHSFVACTALLLAAGACSKAEPRRPDILLVTLDTTRADALGCYGLSPSRSPRLDALAATGIVFDAAIATASLTPVSHASILTGLENHHHGLRVAAGAPHDRLAERHVTLAERLRDAGYQTLHVGGAYPASRRFGLEQGFETFDDVFDPAADPRAFDVRALQRRADEVTTRALALLKDHDEVRPLFLWVHYFDPHDPLVLPPAEFLPQPLAVDAAGTPVMTDELYVAEIAYMDQQIGRLLDAFGAAARDAPPSIVAVVADHGEGLGAHGWPWHRLLYEEQIRVPLVLRAPGLEAGRRIPDVVRTTDLAPTLLELAGVTHPPSAQDGRSLAPLANGQPLPPVVALADAINGFDANTDLPARRPLDAHLYAARERRWKLIYRPLTPERSELFDLELDPHESRNLHDEHPEQAKTLLRELARRSPWLLEPPTDAHYDESLAQLGYVSSGTTIEPVPWRFRCVDHEEVSQPELTPCPRCGLPLIPYGRR